MSDEHARDPEDLDPRVAAALARLESEDPAVAQDARAAWGWLAGDAPPDAPLQGQLQDFLWYALPHKWAGDVGGQLAVVEALARLFDLLDAPRYAQLCRAGETHAIVTAYREDPGEAFDRYRRALDRSGVDPPDVPELAWGTIMSVEEAAARSHVVARLEEAICDGRVVPGGRGWRTAQREVTSAALDESVPGHPGGQTWLQTVVTARLTGWIERYGGSPRRWHLVQRLESALLHPVPVPAAAGEIVAPLRWLLERAAGGGLELTARGNLVRSLVREICERFGWEPLGRATVQRQDDIVELLVWDRFMRSAQLVRRRGRHLVATPAGRHAVADVERSWRAFAAGLGGRQRWDGFLTETVLLLLLDAGDDGMSYEDLTTAVAELAAEAGWRDPTDGRPVPPDVVGSQAAPFVYHLRLMGLASDGTGPRSARTWLRPAGRATAIEALRARGNAPRDSTDA